MHLEKKSTQLMLHSQNPKERMNFIISKHDLIPVKCHIMYIKIL